MNSTVRKLHKRHRPKFKSKHELTVDARTYTSSSSSSSSSSIYASPDGLLSCPACSQLLVIICISSNRCAAVFTIGRHHSITRVSAWLFAGFHFRLSASYTHELGSANNVYEPFSPRIVHYKIWTWSFIIHFTTPVSHCKSVGWVCRNLLQLLLFWMSSGRKKRKEEKIWIQIDIRYCFTRRLQYRILIAYALCSGMFEHG